MSGSSFSKKVDDKLVAPMAMVQKTKQDLAYLKENPRPPSAIPKKGRNGSRAPAAQDSDDDYSDDNYDENDFAEDDDDDGKDAGALDAKLDNLRKAMAREATKAQRVVQKSGIDMQAKKNDGKPILKLGPSTGPAMDMEAFKRGVMPTTNNLVIPGQNVP